MGPADSVQQLVVAQRVDRRTGKATIGIGIWTAQPGP